MTPTPGPRTPGLYLVIDGPPSRVGGRFMEVEDETGASVRVEGATWREEVEQWSLGPFSTMTPTPDPLRAALDALDRILVDSESQHPGGWGPDVTTVADLRHARDGILAALAQPAPALDVERLLRVETTASILVSVVNAIMPVQSPYGCPHSRDWLNGVLDNLREALRGDPA